MKPGDFTEKRKFKRLDLSIPLKIRHALANGREERLECATEDVSYNGAYISGIDISNINKVDKLNISLSVPKDSSRDFPFSRIVGKARIVRIEKDGIALEFTEEMSRLFVAN